MKIKFTKVAKSLTGFSTPVFGISWNPPETDCQIARKLITFLEDRMALYVPIAMEEPEYVVESVLQIRKELANLLQTLDDASDILPHIRAMRAACRKFMQESGASAGRLRYSDVDYEFFSALGELRGVFGIHIAQLCVKYGIDVEVDLAAILPKTDSGVGQAEDSKA